MEGRTAVYESIVNGDFSFTPNMPESFNVLIKELQGLVLDIELLTGDELITNEQLNNISAGIRDDDVPSSDDVVRNISLDIEADDDDYDNEPLDDKGE